MFKKKKFHISSRKFKPMKLYTQGVWTEVASVLNFKKLPSSSTRFQVKCTEVWTRPWEAHQPFRLGWLGTSLPQFDK